MAQEMLKNICPQTKCVVIVVLLLESDERKEKLAQKQHFQVADRYCFTTEV